MNELEQTLQQILQKSMEIAEQTGEFVINQAPDLLKQFFLWHIVSDILGILLAPIILFIGIKVIGFWGENEEIDYCETKFFNKYYDKDSGVIPAIAILSVLFPAALIIFCINAYDLIYILIAPKLYLIEYFIK